MNYRDCLKDVLPYVPGRSEEEIKREYGLDKVVKIASNENPYGPTPAIGKFIGKINYEIYPDNYVTNLRENLAKELDVSQDFLLFGNGSVEIIQMISRILLDEGDNIITELPSFSSYFSEAKIQNANIKTIRYNNEYNFNLEDMIPLIDKKTKIIYITNPNNPLGTIIESDKLEKFIKKVPSNILIVIDEAYFEFVRDEKYKSAIGLVKDYSNVCVLRTFSKAYGLAALRIGYVVADKKVITELEKVRVPFNTSSISQIFAGLALKDKKFMRNSVEKIHDTIDYMYRKLDDMNIEYIKTQANFIMINLNKKSDIGAQELIKRGYIVRGGFPLMDNWIRVSISTYEDMEGFICALQEVIK